MKRVICVLLALTLALAFSCCAENTPAVDDWQLESRTDEALADGVVYTELVFSDAFDDPHRVYLLTVDPNKAYLHTGTSQNGMEFMPSQKQTVMEHMQAARDDGLPVIAGVNGDFFAISSSYAPSGLTVKDGTVISAGNYRPFSAYTTDGRFLICSGTEKVDLQQLQTAVGGSHLLVEEGKPLDFRNADSFATIWHPRTLAGVRADGTILLAVIDGRQPAHSNGASLTQCAQLMHSLGAVRAINHDGGGSSTMVVQQQGENVLKNSPSDGSMRQIFDSILVVTK